MTQRVFVAVSDLWADRAALTDWIKRLPKGSEVLYAPHVDGDGVDILGELIDGAGALAASIPGDRMALPKGERLDAVIVFAGGPSCLEESVVMLDAWNRGIRATLVPPKTKPKRWVYEA